MRLFLAIPVPLDIAAATAPLEGPEFRPVPDVSAHITVRFIGEADSEDVVAAMDGFAAESMEARFTHAGAFPDSRRARVAWLGVEAEGLQIVAEQVQMRVADIGKPDTKDFVAHVTLGRCKRPQDLRVALSNVQVPQTAFELNRIDLMASELTRRGAEYAVLASWELD